jgi:hypothetical protein
MARIQAQVDALNSFFGAHDVKFALQLPINRVTDPTWANVRLGSQEERDMKASLRRGGAESLNLYIVQPADGILGWSTFPFDFAANPKSDGVVILHDTLPGGQAAPYNLGMTAVHETGHWMGLFHPWQGGCTGGATAGDGVPDTPPAKRAAYGCPAPGTVKTCPASAGADATSNAMGYVDDRCMTAGFTEGQAARMRVMWRAYRRTPAARGLEQAALTGATLQDMAGWWVGEQQGSSGGGGGALVPEAGSAAPKPPPPKQRSAAPAAAPAAVQPLDFMAPAPPSPASAAAAAAAVAASGIFTQPQQRPAASAAGSSTNPYAGELARLLQQQQQQQQQRGPAAQQAQWQQLVFGSGGAQAAAPPTPADLASFYGGTIGGGVTAAGGAISGGNEDALPGDAGYSFTVAPAPPASPKTALQLARGMPTMLQGMYGRSY